MEEKWGKKGLQQEGDPGYIGLLAGKMKITGQLIIGGGKGSFHCCQQPKRGARRRDGRHQKTREGKRELGVIFWGGKNRLCGGNILISKEGVLQEIKKRVTGVVFRSKALGNKSRVGKGNRGDWGKVGRLGIGR